MILKFIPKKRLGPPYSHAGQYHADNKIEHYNQKWERRYKLVLWILEKLGWIFHDGWDGS